MANYCGKCGSKLDEATGLCPNCDAAKIKQHYDKTTEDKTPVRKEDKIDKQTKKKALKARKKAVKREKRANWSTGKKVRRFFLKLILAVLFLSIFATVIAGALVYFEVMDIPYISSIIGKLKAENQNAGIVFDNGDYVFTPTEEHIAYDADINMLYFNNQLIVYTFSELSEDDAVKLADLVEGEIVGHLSGSINALQIRVKTSTLDELKSMATQLMKHTDVLYAGYDYPMQLSPVEVDSNPWSTDRNNPIEGRSEESNPEGNDWWAEAIGAYTAWNYSDECRSIKVGIIDSGFDVEHEDLSGRITFLPEYSTNSEDNHGTHVAGIIGANNNTVGIRGIADSADLICVDWSPTDSINYLSTGEYIEIIKQLVENDTKVINNSWGNYFLSKDGYTQNVYGKDNGLKYLLEYSAIHTTGAYDSYVEYCEALSDRTGLECTIIMIQLMLNGYDDFLIVQAAGNGKDNGGPGVDTHYSSFFCAIDAEIYNILSESVRNTLSQKGIDYNTIDERILVVGAVENNCDTRGYRMSQYSNFGSNVDICAPGGKGGNNPGENIFSTLVDNNYGELSGTSMAAPMVTGSAALVWSLNPELSAPEVRDILLTNTSVQAYGVGDGASYTYPMLNVGAAAEAVVSDMMSNFDKGDVPAEAVEYNGHYYYLYDLDMVTTWEEAKEYCESQGGYLATITSMEEDEFLYSYITDMGYDSVLFGLSDIDQDNVWTWVTGEPFSYENWASGEPSHQGGYEHYGMYYEKYKDGSWNDGSGKNCPFLCEWGEYSAATTPPSENYHETDTAFGKYLAAAAKTTETGSWSEQLTLEADMSIAYDGGRTKTTVTLTADSDVSNYVEDDLSQIKITSLANMKVMGQTYAWSTEYYDGVAHYEYTEPFQRSESLEIPPDFFDFEASIPEEAILTEEISGNQIRFIISGEGMTETGIAAVQQMSGVNSLECEDVEVIATLNDSGSIDQIEMNFNASVEYQGYDADVTYRIQYTFS